MEPQDTTRLPFLFKPFFCEILRKHVSSEKQLYTSVGDIATRVCTFLLDNLARSFSAVLLLIFVTSDPIAEDHLIG